MVAPRRLSVLLFAVSLWGCGADDGAPPAGDGSTTATTDSASPDADASSTTPTSTDPTTGADASTAADSAETGAVDRCGDGQVDPGELCDDGNTTSNDGCSATCAPEQDLEVPYNEAPAAATHNSYSGDEGGARGSMQAQLDAGVRTVEFDVHADDFAAAGYRIGHDGPGDEVWMEDGNPTTDALAAWFSVLVEWSDTHWGHSPITVYIDLKDTFAGDHPDDGNFGAFNALLETQFGERLYTPEHLRSDGSWPWVADMRDRFVLVLTGSEDGQLDYRRDRGVDPAIAINDAGQVVEVHQSQSEEVLWSWSGQLQPDGSIRWMHHERYDTGNRPAVALNNDGVLVEVHEDPDLFDDDLWYRVGRVQRDGSVSWSTQDGRRFPDEDEGVMPSIAFDSLDDDAVREVHTSQSSAQRWYWSASSVDVAGGTIGWSRPDGDGQTNDPAYPRSAVTHGGTQYTVSAGPDGPHDQALLYTADGTTRRVRYEQLAFGSARESSKDDLLEDGLEFFADNAVLPGGRAWVAERNAQGKLTRLWGFDEAQVPTQSPRNPVDYGATDHPYEAWHVAYCELIGCVR